jgi:hypothetical protein
MINDLNKSYMVGMRGSPIYTCMFGFRTDIIRNMSFEEMTERFFELGTDFFRFFAGEIFKLYPCKTYTLEHDNKFFHHYHGLQRALEFLQHYNKDSWDLMSTTPVYFKATMQRLINWSNEYNRDLKLGNKILNKKQLAKILQKIGKSKFNLRDNLLMMENDLKKLGRTP